MSKIIAMIAGMTSAGKKVRGFFEGKKQALAGLASGLTGTATIIAEFSQAPDPIAFLLNVAKNPAFLAAITGWGLFFNALKGEKTRAEIAEVKKISE